MLFKFNWPQYMKQQYAYYKCRRFGLNRNKELGEIMNSTDSLSTGGNVQEGAQQDTLRKVDTFMQGSENQESPGGGSAHSSISPPITLMNDITTATTTTMSANTTATVPITLPQLCAPATAPIGSHQILVDPTTGQHFLVSSTPAPPPHPQIIYQPVYYSATPAQPVYYHAFTSGTPGPYVVAATPISGPQSGTQVTSSHVTLGQRFSSTPPPQPPIAVQGTMGGFVCSVADFDETRSVVTTDERHTVFEHPLVSVTRTASRAVDAKQVIVSKNSVSPPQTSPVFTKSCSIFDSLVTTSLSNQQRVPVQLNLQESVSTTYQQPVSKTVHHFSSDAVTVTRPQQDEGERTPLFGVAPAWWGENVVSSKQAHSDMENARTVTTSENVASRRPLKSIRMDIDLNEPFVDEEVKKEEKTKIASRTSSSTAFTVSFDSEEGSPKSNLSLQDAAKKTSSRRFLRRSAPITTGLVSKGAAAKIAGLKAASSDPKQYLLNKMLMGVGEESGEGPDLTASFEEGEGKADIDDTLSEAGTYVVDDTERTNQMTASQTVKECDAESVSSESTTTQNSDNLRPPSTSMRIGSVLPQINENVTSGESGAEKGDHMLREMFRITSGRIGQRRGVAGRQMVAPSTPPLSNSARPSATTPVTRLQSTRHPESTIAEERPYSSHRLCSLASSSRTTVSGQLQRTQPVTSATSDTTFKRGDGGRYSMRFSGGTGAKGQQVSTGFVRSERPPFRVGGSGRAQTSAAGVNKESAEMTAWLRRKDYNPMKAAAEAKKLQQLKARADKFVSNRSISFHQGARPSTNFQSGVRDLNKTRHNRSQDDLSADDAVCGPETILASYSKGITRDLNKLRSVEAAKDKARVNGLENAVQQLTMKCNRSIELIRNSHQGHLSESVENLLEMAVEPVKDFSGTVTDQLDRLSAAFDAIQKYLEVSSASLPPSPSESSPTASVAALSTSPSRRSCSAYQSKLAAAKRSPSGGRKNS